MHEIGGCGGLCYSGGRLKMYMLLQMIAMSRQVVRLMLLYQGGESSMDGSSVCSSYDKY